MEEKQLNYNQPFLSVRRFTATLASEKNEETDINQNPSTNSSLPNYRSELKSGPVSHPGTVPFMWEKSPGRPKYENEPLTRSFELPPISPRLPPGRVTKAKDRSLENFSEISSPTPTSYESPRFASNWLNYSSLHEINVNTEALKDDIEEKESSDSLDNDEAYQDALETLSRTESLFSSCGLSGWSGLDEPEVKQSGIFSTDPQSRDFMMGRFLPAAKEIVCDSTRPAFRKPILEAQQQPQLLKDVMYKDRRPLFHRPKPNILPNNAEVYREVESENEDNDYDEPGNLSTRGCGLLPSFCLPSNVPGVRVRKFALSRRQIRSSFATSALETIKEGTGVADQEQRYSDQYRKPELCDYDQSTGSINQKLDGRSLYTRLQGAGIPTREDKLPQSRFYIDGDVGNDSFNSEKRCTDAFEKLSGHQRAERDLDSTTSMFEETLYVDPVYKVASPEIESLSSKWRELEDSINTNAKISEVMGIEARPYSGSRCINLDDSEIIEVESEENSYETDSQFLIPPPSLKTPSESWLWRTLPTMSSKISTSGSNLGKKELSGPATKNLGD